MLLKKRLRAGILLYALFMAAVFALFLQFYMGRVTASHQIRDALYHHTQAQLMAEMTKTQAKAANGSYRFEQGETSYQKTADQLLVTVTLSTGSRYRYEFFISEKATPKEVAKPDFPKKSEQDLPVDSSLQAPSDVVREQGSVGENLPDEATDKLASPAQSD